MSRFALGLTTIFLLEFFYPLGRPHVWIYVAYLIFAAVEQGLIWYEIGGEKRTFVAGLVDFLVLTLAIHWMGSIMAMMATVYVLAAVINVVAVGPRVGVVLSVVGALAYQVDVWLEWAGVLPFAPDVPQLAALGPPALGAVMLTCTLVTAAIVGPTAVVAWLVHGLRIANEQLESLSERDPLTDLYNRRYLLARMEMELLRAKRGHALCLMMIDLDGFKRVNDGQGHLRGDLLLKEISSALAAAVRATDVVARYGGDEFALLLPDTDSDHAHVVAARVVTQVHGVGARFDAARPVTASLGIAQATVDDAVASLIRHADENAYRAKKAGGNRVVA